MKAAVQPVSNVTNAWAPTTRRVRQPAGCPLDGVSLRYSAFPRVRSVSCCRSGSGNRTHISENTLTGMAGVTYAQARDKGDSRRRLFEPAKQSWTCVTKSSQTSARGHKSFRA
jgi:hypothetical protein